MDNLNTHKMSAVRAAIEAVGALPVYLPTYSPELNPIELWWADMKRALRTLALDTEPAVRRAVRGLRARLQPERIAAWFRFSLRQVQLNDPCVSGWREQSCPETKDGEIRVAKRPEGVFVQGAYFPLSVAAEN